MKLRFGGSGFGLNHITYIMACIGVSGVFMAHETY